MKTTFLLLFSTLILHANSFANSGPDVILGEWLSQEKDGKISIYKQGDKYYGKIEGQKFIFRNQENQAGIIQVGGYIAEGTYSTIHKGIYQYSKDSELENIVLRISKYEPPNQDDKQLFLKYIAEYRQELISGLEESLLGIVLYCYIQNLIQNSYFYIFHLSYILYLYHLYNHKIYILFLMF